jgi:hypothetical protein
VPQFTQGGLPSERMTDQHICHHFKILLNANRPHSIPARKANMRSDSGVGNITSKIIAAVLSFLLLLFSLAGLTGVITRAYAGTANLVKTEIPLRSGSSYTHHASVLVPEEATTTDTPTDTPTPTPTPTNTPTPTPTPTPTRTPRPTPTPSPTPTDTPTPTPTHTPTPTTAPGFTPTPGSTATPQGTATATVIPTATGTDLTPTLTPSVVPVTNNNGGTPPATKTGGGSPIPFILITASVLLILGMVSVVAFVFLRGSLSPVPQAKLRPSGALPWRRLGGHNLHGNTNINGVPFVVEGDRSATAYNGPFLPGPGGTAANNQPQVPFGYSLPPANWRPGSAPTNIPQAPFSGAPTQSTMPQNSFLQQGSGPIRFRAAGDNNTAPNQQPFPTQNMQPPPSSTPSEEQLRRLAQQRLIAPPEEPQNEDWIR